MSFKTESQYSYSSPLPLRARMHNTGAVRIGQLVQVQNLTNGNTYTVSVEGKRARCTCKGYTHHYAGTLKTCRRGGAVLALLAEQERDEAAAAAWEKAERLVDGFGGQENPGLEFALAEKARILKDRELWN